MELISRKMVNLEGLLRSSMNDEFIIEVCGDLDFEGMTIQLTYNMQLVAMVNYDKGIDKIEIELFPDYEEVKASRVPFNGFLEVLEKAKKIAIRCEKEDTEIKKMEKDLGL